MKRSARLVRTSFLAVVVAAATIGCGDARAASVQASPFVMITGVVVDPASRALYMMNPDGGIDAVEVASGAPGWSTKNAAKPLIAVGRRLLAQSAARN